MPTTPLFNSVLLSSILSLPSSLSKSLFPFLLLNLFSVLYVWKAWFIKFYNQIETKEEVKASKNNPKIETSTPAQNQEPKQNVAVEKLPEESKLQFKLPNIFTPNGDGNNDYLKLDIDNVTEFVIVVLDAKSNVVFKSEEVDFKWDGTNLNGDKLPAGNYIYYVTAKDLEGKAVTKYSALTIKF